jgi:hypothetical protein
VRKPGDDTGEAGLHRGEPEALQGGGRLRRTLKPGGDEVLFALFNASQPFQRPSNALIALVFLRCRASSPIGLCSTQDGLGQKDYALTASVNEAYL